MVDRLGRLPVLAIFTFRPGFEPAWAGVHNVTTLALGRLEQPQVQAMVEQVTGGRALPAEVMKEIINKTDELAAAMMREAESLPGLPELCTAHRLCAITCQVEGNFDGAREHLERAIAAYDGKHSRTPALDFWGHQDVASMAHLAWVLWPLGEIDRARHLAEEAIVLAQRCGHVPTLAYAHGVTSNLEVMRRDARRVMTHGRAVVDLTREHGLPYWLAHGTIQVGWALWHSGDREAGEAGMREGMVLLRERAAQVFPFPYRILQAEGGGGSGPG